MSEIVENVVEEVVAPVSSTVTVDGIFFDGLSNELALPDKSVPITDRSSALREILKRAAFIDNKLQLAVGEALYEVKSNGYWKDWKVQNTENNFGSFDQFVETEMKMKKRKSAYLVDIYQTFIVKLGIPKEEINDLEWSKAKEVTKIINSTNWKDIVDHIKPLTVEQTEEYVKNYGKLSTTPNIESTPNNIPTPVSTPMETMKTFKVSLLESHHEALTTALEIAGVLTKSDSVSYRLSMICAEFINTYVGHQDVDGFVNRIEDHIKRFEETFGIKLEIVGKRDDIVPALKTDE